MASLTLSIGPLKPDASTLQAWCSLGRSHDKQEVGYVALLPTGALLIGRQESSSEAQVVQPIQLGLSSLSRKFSMSAYLSPRPVETRDGSSIVTFNQKPLDATYLVLLALNEECRRIRRGCFYHLALRQDVSKGHPCDMVFIDEPWGEKSVKAWDTSRWDKRLKICAAASGCAHIHTSNSDPAIANHPAIRTWSRPLMDTSRILIPNAHQHSTATVAHLNAVEHASQCTTFPTPNDLSLTALPNWQQTTTAVFGRRPNCDAPTSNAQPVLAVKVTNAEVVLAMLYIWNRGRVAVHHSIHPNAKNNNDDDDDLKLDVMDHWETEFGSTKVLWQEVEDRIDNHSLDTQKAMLEFWPKG
ncbi:hypothetical protein Z517_04032 [Fonsecaea pedrosoi CBS 271.37]|uniref:Uncharacterized protein n=1 Tax=Fonsecaea pedrosoi CBS 271.37 TaxID=1442368 RepID=A0A0D2H8Z0_9EURO|nr:uncharacterized protein Z517_04032 [Fonsecaea pedrosoi CBS 271.37]KIW81009.1 hypothetical protein Z517_04032 [Fonsecaea pedrosoi CBS 271.37]